MLRTLDLTTMLHRVGVAGTDRVQSLLQREWDFADFSETTATHGFHPYPARFIAQIPALILEALAAPDSVVLDPFVGSGTTIVEATRRGLRSVGIDSNPLAVLIASAKATLPSPDALAVRAVADSAAKRAAQFYSEREYPLDYVDRANELAGPRFSGVDFWFSIEARMELTALREAIDQYGGLFRSQSLAALSAIVVRASRQDSDTRYVRREKRFSPLSCVQWWTDRMEALAQGLGEIESEHGRSGSPDVRLGDSREIGTMDIPAFHLAITSSPYPNAFTYSLYHQLRAIWIGIPVEGLRRTEIGNHRDYSRRGGLDRDSFLADMTATLSGMRTHAQPGAVLAFVIGDSIIRGERVDNTAVLREAAEAAGLSWVGDVKRTIRPDRKSLNPSIGGIKAESICFVVAP